MQVIRTFVTALLVTLVVQPSAECQPSRDVGALQRQVRALIDDGRYVEAEREARALFASFGARSKENSIELNRVTDLLVEALARNGRGAEADTRTLAEEMVRRREAGSGEDTPAHATA